MDRVNSKPNTIPIKRLNFEGAQTRLNTDHQIFYSHYENRAIEQVEQLYYWVVTGTKIVPGKATKNYKLRQEGLTICAEDELGDRAYSAVQKGNAFCKDQNATNPCYQLNILQCKNSTSFGDGGFD